MTSVNSPACLLARNHFYRNLPSSPEQMKPVDDVFNCQNNSVRHNQRQVTLWVTMATPHGLPGGTGTKGLWVNIALGSSSSPLFVSTSKPASPADQGVK